MQASANQEFTADPAIDELNRIVEQAETLLSSLGEEGGEAAEAVRQRVTQTLNDAKARLATAAVEAEHVAQTVADRADDYVHKHPWRAVALAAVLGGAAAFLIVKATRRP
jgi:ElaB/YqjD/DUF883 family membrane-anchored ribosome-binding protein